MNLRSQWRLLMVGTLLGLGAVPGMAAAQAADPLLQPTNIPGTSFVARPPAEFNPLTAPDAALAQYHVAPRPDATAAPEAYARWAKAATFKGTRVTPQLKQTNVVNGPMHAAATAQAPRNTENGIIGTSSTNWSGEALVSTAKSRPSRWRKSKAISPSPT